MTTKEKIKYYIDSKGISKNKFYTITGLSTSFWIVETLLASIRQK